MKPEKKLNLNKDRIVGLPACLARYDPCPQNGLEDVEEKGFLSSDFHLHYGFCDLGQDFEFLTVLEDSLNVSFSLLDSATIVGTFPYSGNVFAWEVANADVLVTVNVGGAGGF